MVKKSKLIETRVSANIAITMSVSWCQHMVTTEKHGIKVQLLVLRTCIWEVHVSRVNENGGYTDGNVDLFLVLELKIWIYHAKVVEITTMDSGDYGI